MTMIFFFSSRRRHTRLQGDWSSDVCSSDLDLTLALILACRRHLLASERFVRERRWQRGWAQPELLGRDLAGSTLGLVGRGRIGRKVARRAEAFDMSVVHRRRSDGLPLDELLGTSDVVSL